MNKKSLIDAYIDSNLSFQRERLNTLALSYYLLFINAFMLSLFMQQMFLHGTNIIEQKSR